MARDSSSAATDSKKKSKGKSKTLKEVTSLAKVLSKETIDSDDDEEDDSPAEEKGADDIDDSEDEASEADSENLEGVTPRNRHKESAAGPSGRATASKASRFS